MWLVMVLKTTWPSFLSLSLSFLLLQLGLRLVVLLFFFQGVIQGISGLRMLKQKGNQAGAEPGLMSTKVTFESLGLDARLTRALARSHFIKPTLVQATSIPIAFQVCDLLHWISELPL